ncbi:MAG: hypothetical protein ACE5PT_07235 [Gemmatimonadales bacterium]
MKIDFAVACDYAVVDQYGKLSVLGIFQHIWVGQFPVVHPRLHLVLRLKGRRTEIGDHQVRIRLCDEDGNKIIKGDGTVAFSEPPAGVTEIEAGCVLVFDVPFQRAGRYCFAITVDDDVATEVPITVAQGPPRRARPSS